MLFARTRTSGSRGSTLRLVVLSVAMLVSSAQPAGSMTVSEDPDPLLTRSGGYGFSSTEVCFMKKINRTRQSNGLNPLRWDKQMGYVARRHARQMASDRAVYHDANMGNEITHWRRLGQNTGAGRNCRSLFRSFMRSPSHRANILGSWRYLGVGVEQGGGKVFVQQIFENRRDPGNIYHWP